MKRAAWLDNEIEWVSIPSDFELRRLGLGSTDVVLIEKQVDITFNVITSDAVITVRNVEIVSMDKPNRQLSYRVRGETKLSQKWEPGGSLLSPDTNRMIIS